MLFLLVFWAWLGAEQRRRIHNLASTWSQANPCTSNYIIFIRSLHTSSCLCSTCLLLTFSPHWHLHHSFESQLPAGQSHNFKHSLGSLLNSPSWSQHSLPLWRNLARWQRSISCHLKTIQVDIAQLNDQQHTETAIATDHPISRILSIIPQSHKPTISQIDTHTSTTPLVLVPQVHHWLEAAALCHMVNCLLQGITHTIREVLHPLHCRNQHHM